MTASAPLDLPRLEHDACGVALLADVRRRSSHELVERGLHALARLAHRGGGAGPVTLADGAGVLTAIPWKLLASDVAVPEHGARARAAGMVFFPAAAADFAAGMSGGVVYVYNPDARFMPLCNHQMVETALPAPDELAHLHGLVATHADLTGSACAAALPEHWSHASRSFRKVTPLLQSGALTITAAESLDARDPLAASA